MPTQALLGVADPVSAITHLAGAAVAMAATGRLVARGNGSRAARAGLAVFAACCILLFGISGVYHLFDQSSPIRAVFQRLDHAAIFILIAGTFTPVHLIVFRGVWRWGVLAAIWSAAVLGIALKMIFFDALPESIGMAVYLGLGWLGAISACIMWRHFGFALVRPAFLGGIAYTIGGLIGAAGQPEPIPGVVGSHELFHMVGLVGLYCWWRFMGEVATCPPIRDPLAGLRMAPPAGRRGILAESLGGPDRAA